MSGKGKVKLAVDLLMILFLLALMGWHLWGDTAHEWIGTGMLLLFVLHHALNVGWYGSLFRGKWRLARVVQNAINLLLFADMLCLTASGIMMSRHVFGFLNLNGGMGLARSLHLVGSYWGFVLMSMHMGLHGGVMARLGGVSNRIKAMAARVILAIVSAYGLWAFIQRGFPTYMTLQSQFVFFDFTESPFLFYLDYLAIMVLFAAATFYLTRLLHRRNQPRKRSES